VKNARSRQGLPTSGSLQPFEQIVPLAAECIPQTHDDFYGRTLPSRLHVLVVTFCDFRACGELVLGETKGEADSLEILIHIITLCPVSYVTQPVADAPTIRSEDCQPVHNSNVLFRGKHDFPIRNQLISTQSQFFRRSVIFGFRFADDALWFTANHDSLETICNNCW